MTGGTLILQRSGKSAQAAALSVMTSKAIVNKNTLTSTFYHNPNRVRFSLSHLLTY